jgi:hypothetical protein
MRPQTIPKVLLFEVESSTFVMNGIFATNTKADDLIQLYIDDRIFGPLNFQSTKGNKPYFEFYFGSITLGLSSKGLALKRLLI